MPKGRRRSLFATGPKRVPGGLVEAKEGLGEVDAQYGWLAAPRSVVPMTRIEAARADRR